MAPDRCVGYLLDIALVRVTVSGVIMRLILASLALVTVVLPAWGQTVLSHEQTYRRSVQSGQELRVFTYGQWHKDCRPKPPPQIVVQVTPSHGTVSLRPGPVTVAFVREGMPDCVGKKYSGLGVWSIPAPGFRGVDQFSWDVIGSATVSHDTAIVEVQ
jgi:hypothetical protein